MLNWSLDFLKSIAQVNCMAVADTELGSPVRIPIELLEAGRLDEHWCDKKHRHMAVIGEDGEHHLHHCLALHDPTFSSIPPSDRDPHLH